MSYVDDAMKEYARIMVRGVRVEQELEDLFRKIHVTAYQQGYRQGEADMMAEAWPDVGM